MISVFLQSKLVCKPILHTYLLLLFFFSLVLIFDAVMHQMCNVVDEISMKCYHRTYRCGPYRMPQVERSNYRYAVCRYMGCTQYLCKQDLFVVLPSIMSSFGQFCKTQLNSFVSIQQNTRVGYLTMILIKFARFTLIFHPPLTRYVYLYECVHVAIHEANSHQIKRCDGTDCV